MSDAVTDRGAVGGDYATSRATSAFTPAANSLLLAWVSMAGNTTSVSGITGHGTWEVIEGPDSVQGTYSNLELWGCIVGGSPSSAAVSVSHGSSKSSIAVVEVDPASYGGATVSAAVVQNANAAAYVTGSGPFTIEPSLSAFASGSMVITGCSVFGNTVSTTFTEQGSLTQDAELVPTGAPWPPQMHVSSFEGEDTSPAVQSTQSYMDNLAIAVEIAEVGGGGGSGGGYSNRLSLLGVG